VSSAAARRTQPGLRQLRFQVLPRRWVVERLPAWVDCSRLLAQEFEGAVASAAASLHAAYVMLLIRRIARST